MSPGIESTNSSSFTVPAVTSYRSPGGTPVLVVKSKDDVEKFIQALPLLTGALVSSAGRAGAKKLLGVAGKRLAAVKDARAASKITNVGRGNTMNALRGKPYTGMQKKPVKVTSYKNIPEGLEVPKGHDSFESFLDSSDEVQSLGQSTANELKQPTLDDFGPNADGTAPSSSPASSAPDGRRVAGAKRRALQSEVDRQYATDEGKRKLSVSSKTQTQLESGTPADPLSADEKQALTAGGIGVASYGVQQGSRRAAENQAKQQAEMERIERLAEEGRAKASTGSKIAVT